MFEIGKKYKLEMLDSTDNEGRPAISSITVTVTDAQGPLIKTNAGGTTEVVNTHSPVFIRATLQK